jgi:hypothetical protein
MDAVRATVKDGRLIVDEPTTLPEGTVLDLVLDDEGDDLDQHDRARLHAAINRSAAEAREGHVRPATAILSRLGTR